MILELNGVKFTDNEKNMVILKKSNKDDAYVVVVNKSNMMQAYDFHVSIDFILQKQSRQHKHDAE